MRRRPQRRQLLRIKTTTKTTHCIIKLKIHKQKRHCMAITITHHQHHHHHQCMSRTASCSKKEEPFQAPGAHSSGAPDSIKVESPAASMPIPEIDDGAGIDNSITISITITILFHHHRWRICFEYQSCLEFIDSKLYKIEFEHYTHVYE